MNSNNLLSCIEINPDSRPTHSVIVLHGLGADGHDFVPIVNQLAFSSHLAVRFVFPHAPMRPVTINQGYVMRAWFDITSLHLNHGADEQGIVETIDAVNALITREEEHGVLPQNIILAGFSQGSVIALRTALAHQERLAGVVALSGFLPDPERVLREANPANQKIPIFIGHGTGDTTVPFVLGEATAGILKRAGYPVSWHAYQDLPHSVCDLEIQDISKWVEEIFRS